MQNYKKTIRFFTAVIYLWIQLFANIAFAQSEEQRVLEALAKNLPAGNSVGSNTETKEVNGISVTSVQYWTCTETGKCIYSKKQEYITKNVLVQRDGHFYAAQTIDKGGRDPSRIAFSSISANSKSGNISDIDPATVSRIDLSPNSQLYHGGSGYNGVENYLPQVTLAISGAIQSMNQIAAVSEALQKSYKEVLKKTAHVADGLDEIAKKRDAISKIQSSVLNSGISASLSDPSFYQQNKDYQDYLKSYNSPYSFKQYDLTETALNNSYKEFKKSINDGKIRAAIESAKTLLNQRNRNLRSEADKNLYPYFSDGIFQTSSINQNRNSLFDKSKFATNRNTPEGQALRNIINKAQLTWIESGGLQNATDSGVASYLMGANSIRAVDDYFAKGQKESGYALLAVADSLIDLTRGVSRGLVNNLVQTAQSIPMMAGVLVNYGNTLINDPNEGLEIAGTFIQSLPSVAETLLIHTLQQAKTLGTGTAEERGEVLGDLMGTVLTTLVTQGSASVVKNGAKILKVSEQSSRVANVASRLGLKALDGTRQVTQDLVGARTVGLVGLSFRSPKAAIETVKVMRDLSRAGRENAKEFLGKALANGSRTRYLTKSGDAEKIAKAYIQIEAALAKITPVKFDGPVSRGVLESVEVNGKIIRNTPDDVFRHHKGMIYADGRYSIGGPEGDFALYTTLGGSSSPSVRNNIVRELGMAKSPNSIIYAEKNVSLSKGLDLTNLDTIKNFGLSEEILTNSKMNGHYFFSQIIGNASRKAGIEFIVAPSAMKKGIKNIIILF